MNQNKFAAMAVVDDEDVPQVVAKKVAPKKTEPTKKIVVVKKSAGAMGDDGFESVDKTKKFADREEGNRGGRGGRGARGGRGGRGGRGERGGRPDGDREDRHFVPREKRERREPREPRAEGEGEDRPARGGRGRGGNRGTERHGDRPQREARKAELRVNGMAEATTEEALRAIFEAHGEVTKCKYLAFKGVCFVEYADDSNAKKALAAVNSSEVDGATLSV